MDSISVSTSPDLKDAKVILTGLVGSRGFGTATDDSDYDFMSIVIPSDRYFGLRNWGTHGTGSVEHSYDDPELGHVEHKYFDLKRFIELCCNVNPNIIPLLWLKNYRKLTPEGEQLVSNRAIFNSKKIFHTFGGYARNQMQKMGGVFFDVQQENQLLRDGLATLWANLTSDSLANGVVPLSSGYKMALQRVTAMIKEEIKKTPVGPSTGRMGAKRKEIREQFGFDTKFAMHTIRSLNMAVEFLEDPDRGLLVDRTAIDATFLLNIRGGRLSQEEIKQHADSLFKRCEAAYQRSSLPELVDIEQADSLLTFILNSSFSTY